VKHHLPNLTAVLAALVLAGCTSVESGGSSSVEPAKQAETPKPAVRVAARLLTYREIQDFAEKHPALNVRLKTLAPTMAYNEGQAKADLIPLVATAAGLVTEELVKWVGNSLEAEAKKHSAQFGAFVQQPDWWTEGQPDVAAVELTRTEGAGAEGAVLFDAIVLIRPIFSTLPPGRPKLAAFQLVPVYLLETKPAAEDFGKTMGAVLSVSVECSWTTDGGVPKSEVIATYTYKLKEYEEGQPVLVAAKEDSAADTSKGPPEMSLSDASHYFAMPERAATIGATFGVAETDPSKWVGVLEKLGEAIGGQASGAGTAVKNKLSPPST
jgi:hypothetical protein